MRNETTSDKHAPRHPKSDGQGRGKDMRGQQWTEVQVTGRQDRGEVAAEVFGSFFLFIWFAIEMPAGKALVFAPPHVYGKTRPRRKGGRARSLLVQIEKETGSRMG